MPLELRRSGYAPLLQTVVPDSDQRLLLSLHPRPGVAVNQQFHIAAQSRAEPPMMLASQGAEAGGRRQGQGHEKRSRYRPTTSRHRR